MAELTAAARPRLLEESDGSLRVESRLDRDLQTVGDANELRWTLHLPPGAELLDIRWNFEGAAGLTPWWRPGEIPEEMAQRISTLNPDSLSLGDFVHRRAEGDSLVLSLPFSLLVPDTLEIASPTFLYGAGGDTASFTPGSLPVACMSLLATTPDSTALRDWKAPGELRGDWLTPLLKWGLPLLALILAAIAFTIWWRRRARPEEEEPPVPAHEEALAALAELEREGLPAQGQFHAFYTRLSLILRRYLGRRYGLPYPDWTREEIVDSLIGLPLSAEMRQTLPELLERADTVKYAKRQPHVAECETSLDYGRGLVGQTREHPETLEGAA